MATPKKNQSMFDSEKEDVRPAQTTPQATMATHVHEHEHSDVDIRAIIKYTVILLGSLGVVQLLLWGVFKILESRADHADAAITVSPLADTAWNASGPQLQVDPVTDRIILQHRADSVLHTYGWIDKGTGTVRIPIEKAIDLVAEEGLPSRKEPFQPMEMGAKEENGGQYSYMKAPASMKMAMPVDTAGHVVPADSSGGGR
jgi:hypothetical protein